MNNWLIILFTHVLHYLANKRQGHGLERTITLLLRTYETSPDQFFSQLYRFSDDSRWILRYLAGREIGRFWPMQADTCKEIWIKLAGDEHLYVREGTAKGITAAAETHFETLWEFWKEAFYHSSELVRQTAAMTLIVFLERKNEYPELTTILEKIKGDPSSKVKLIVDHYLCPMVTLNEAGNSDKESFVTTDELPIPERLIDQVVGQEHAVEVIKLAARQKRSILMIGDPGTGKSMLGKAIAEMLPSSTPVEIIVEAGTIERNIPGIRIMAAGEGDTYISEYAKETRTNMASVRWVIRFAYFTVTFVALYYYLTQNNSVYLVVGAFVLALLYTISKSVKINPRAAVPKYLVKHVNSNRAPFVDATGLQSGAMLGDVRHDPYQSGGLESFPHLLVEPGAIHLAHQGVLYIDEISALSPESQQALLTAFQDKQLSITGRSQGSSGTMIRTEPVPCDFIMVLAGNLTDVNKLHPALRSRITGYGYEIYMNTSMDDKPHNRYRLAQFVAQEVRKDGKIPHFTFEAVEEVIAKAKEMSPHDNRLTTCFRELGGIIRAAGDMAVLENSPFVQRSHVKQARAATRTIEDQQLDNKAIALKPSDSSLRPGEVKVLAMSHRHTARVYRILTEAYPLDEVIIKVSQHEHNCERYVPVEASLYRYQLPGRYYFEIDQFMPDQPVEEFTLALVLAAMSAKLGLCFPDNVIVCGVLHLNGMITQTTYFEQKLEEAKRRGIRTVIAPVSNNTNQKFPGVNMIWVCSLEEAYKALISFHAVRSV